MANIAKLGLKRPVTVSPSEIKNGEQMYYLVCGQGRLESYSELGEEAIPAIVIQGSKEELLLMSLAENVVRRQHSTLELVRDITKMKEKGYTHAEIAAKTDLTVSYVRAILQLLAKGEEKLLQAVERGQIPVYIAITIATSDDKGIQRALTEAYERNDLRGKALLPARRLIENRHARGKGIRGGKRSSPQSAITSDHLLKTYQNETLRQKLTIQRAKITSLRQYPLGSCNLAHLPCRVDFLRRLGLRLGLGRFRGWLLCDLCRHRIRGLRRLGFRYLLCRLGIRRHVSLPIQVSCSYARRPSPGVRHQLPWVPRDIQLVWTEISINLMSSSLPQTLFEGACPHTNHAHQNEDYALLRFQ